MKLLFNRAVAGKKAAITWPVQMVLIELLLGAIVVWAMFSFVSRSTSLDAGQKEWLARDFAMFLNAAPVGQGNYYLSYQYFPDSKTAGIPKFYSYIFETTQTQVKVDASTYFYASDMLSASFAGRSAGWQAVNIVKADKNEIGTPMAIKPRKYQLDCGIDSALATQTPIFLMPLDETSKSIASQLIVANSAIFSPTTADIARTPEKLEDRIELAKTANAKTIVELATAQTNYATAYFMSGDANSRLIACRMLNGIAEQLAEVKVLTENKTLTTLIGPVKGIALVPFNKELVAAGDEKTVIVLAGKPAAIIEIGSELATKNQQLVAGISSGAAYA